MLFSDPAFPLVTIINIDADVVGQALTRAGHESGSAYLQQLIDMKYCIPDTTPNDIGNA